MTESSLSASIFGSEENPAKKSSSLSNLFGASTRLPQKPSNFIFTEPAEDREKRERKEEKRKKRKPKSSSVEEEKNQEGERNSSSLANDADECTIFVGNLPDGVGRKELASMFKACGKIKSTRIRSIATAGVKVAPEHAGNQKLVKKVSVNTNKILPDAPKKTGQGYVIFENQESVEKALKMNNTSIPNSKGLLFRVDHAKPTLDSSRSVFVGNLPYKADEMSVREHFKNGCGFGDDVIENVRIVRDSATQKCKGFGYVLLKDKSYLAYALEMHESQYKNKEMRVQVCGKRFKGRKGAAKEETRDTSGALQRVLKKAKKNVTPTLSGDKERKKRGVKKVGAKKSGNSGMSKRAASEKKFGKRVKKIQKRLQKGMGKTKK